MNALFLGGCLALVILVGILASGSVPDEGEGVE